MNAAISLTALEQRSTVTPAESTTSLLANRERARNCHTSDSEHSVFTYKAYTRAYTGINEPDSGTASLRVYVHRFSSTLHVYTSEQLAHSRSPKMLSIHLVIMSIFPPWSTSFKKLNCLCLYTFDLFVVPLFFCPWQVSSSCFCLFHFYHYQSLFRFRIFKPVSFFSFHLLVYFIK